MNNLPSRPGEVFYIIRRTPYSESILSTKAVICEQSYMRWGRRKSQYRLVDIDNGEILDFKAQTFSEMLDFVEGCICKWMSSDVDCKRMLAAHGF